MRLTSGLDWLLSNWMPAVRREMGIPAMNALSTMIVRCFFVRCTEGGKSSSSNFPGAILIAAQYRKSCCVTSFGIGSGTARNR